MVFIDQEGKYYQTRAAKSPGDAKIEHPTDIMLEYLTADPVTIPEFGVGVQKGEIGKVNKEVVKAPKVLELDTVDTTEL